MDFINVFLLCLMSCIIGAVLMVLLQYVAFVKFFKAPPVETSHEPTINQEFALPENIMCNVKSLDPATKNSIIAFNLIFQFLFYETRFSAGVRNWIYRKLTFELEELIAKTTISKFFDKFLLRDLDLGSQFPEIKNLRVHNVDLHPTEGHIESLDVVMNVQYRGNFKVAIDGHMLLGKKVFLSVKVKELSGLARLQFTRRPYSHWSVCFIGDPSLDLEIETLFQGRQLQPHLTGLLSHQIRKVVRRKHTLPTYKIRYKPFFVKPSAAASSAANNQPQQQAPTTTETTTAATATSSPALPSLCGNLEVNISELSRLAILPNMNHVFCTATLLPSAWVQVRRHSSNTVAIELEVRLQRAKNQQLGIMFAQSKVDSVSIERLLPNTPASGSLLLAGDVLLLVEDKPVQTITQVSKYIKALTKREIVFRVERIQSGFLRTGGDYDDQAESGAYDDMTVEDGARLLKTASSSSVLTAVSTTALRKNSNASAISSDSSVATTPNNSPRKPPAVATDERTNTATSVGLSAARKLSKTSLRSQPDDAANPHSQNGQPPSRSRSSELLLTDETIMQTFASDEISAAQPLQPQQHQKLPVMMTTSPSTTILTGSTEQIIVPVWHQHTTVNCLVNTLIKMNDLAHFELEPDSRWLNICVYGRCNDDTELLGYVNIPVANVLAESKQTSLWQLVKKEQLQPPVPTNLPTHALSSLKGFEPRYCFGDVLLSFVWSGPSIGDEEPPTAATATANERTQKESASSRPTGASIISGVTDTAATQPGSHDFVRTQFTRSTQCEYCGKKIWLKDAVQCRRCSMSCHKKCVKKCQHFTVCCNNTDAGGGVEQQPQRQSAVRQPTVQLQLTESPDLEPMWRSQADGTQTPETPANEANRLQSGDLRAAGNTFGELLAQGIKRVNSVNNLAIPGMGGNSNGGGGSSGGGGNNASGTSGGGPVGGSGSPFARSLPPSPQHTPSRKQSLVNQSTNPFVGVAQTLEQLSDCADDILPEQIVALTQPLIGWGTNEELMGLAKTSSRSLYADLEPSDRVDKINILLLRLRNVLDVETTNYELLRDPLPDLQTTNNSSVIPPITPDASPMRSIIHNAQQRRPSNSSLVKQQQQQHLSDETHKTLLTGQSEERVQALSVIMLHLCTGLQYAQGVATQ